MLLDAAATLGRRGKKTASDRQAAASAKSALMIPVVSDLSEIPRNQNHRPKPPAMLHAARNPTRPQRTLTTHDASYVPSLHRALQATRFL